MIVRLCPSSRIFLAGLLALMMLPKGVAAEPVPTSGRNQELFFESRIRPLLIDNCLKCHGEEKQKGGLRLDSHAAILKGGKKGLVLTPGKPENSRLITAVTYKDPGFANAAGRSVERRAGEGAE